MKLLRIPLQPALALVGIALAAVAQLVHVSLQSDVAALLFYGVAVACWVIALAASHVGFETPLGAPPYEPGTRPVSLTLVFSVVGLALLTFLLFGGNEFNSDNLLAWLGSIAVFLYTFWIPERNASAWRLWFGSRATSLRDTLSSGVRFTTRGVLLTGVLLVGVFFYFYNLGGVPAELDSPHAEKILAVRDILGGARPIFLSTNLGHEPLDPYATAAFVAITHRPLDFSAIKTLSAALGVLLVLATFLLARELFGFKVALAAAALIAIGKWPVALARQGLAYPLTPLLLTLMLYFLVRAFKYQRRGDFLLAGVFLGFGLYASEMLRFVPGLVAMTLIGGYFGTGRSPRPRAASYVVNSVLLFALALLVALPLLRYAVDQPGSYWSATLVRMVGEGQPLPADPVVTFASNLWNAASMFNWAGDGSWPLNVPGDPALDYMTGGLLVLGVAYGMYRLLHDRARVYLFILSGLAVMLIPSALSLANPADNPSAVYASGAIPFVFVLAALPVVWTARLIAQMASRPAWGRAAGAGFAILVFAVAARADFVRYFVDFDQVYRQASWNSSEIAASVIGFSKSVGDAEHVWVVAYPNWVDARNVGINMGQVGWQQAIQNADQALALTQDSETKLYVLNVDDHANLSRLQEIFLNGQTRVVRGQTAGHDFVLFYVPGAVPSSGFRQE